MNEFDLNAQWRHYLKRMGLTEERMHPVQLQETKRAFMAACGQILLLFNIDLSALPDEQAMEAIHSMIKQAEAYWLSEISKQN